MRTKKKLVRDQNVFMLIMEIAENGSVTFQCMYSSNMTKEWRLRCMMCWEREFIEYMHIVCMYLPALI